MEVRISTIDEEFEKAKVKGFIRTRKGKMERVKEHTRNQQKWINAWQDGLISAAELNQKLGKEYATEDVKSAPNVKPKELRQLKRSGFKHKIKNGVHIYEHDSGYKAKVSSAGKVILLDDYGQSFKGRIDQFISDANFKR